MLKALKLYGWVIPVLVFVVVELGIIFSQSLGPFFDEGIYVTAGLRAWEGHGLSDQYLTWFNGSLLWPYLAGLGYKMGGLIGSRLMALIMATIAMIAIIHAAKNLFGEQAGFWTGVVIVTNASFLALAHLAVYDLPALAAMAVSFWATTKLIKEDNRLWLVIAAVALGMAVLSKYPTLFMVAPIVLIVMIGRKEKAVMDTTLFGFIVGGIGLVYFLPLREQVSMLVEINFGHTLTFGATRQSIAYALGFYSLTTLILTLVGLATTRGKLLQVSVVSLASLLIWPAFHVIRGDPISDQKHIVFGFLFAFPLCGQALAKLWSGRILRLAVPAVVVVLIGWATYQLRLLDYSWPDVREGAAYLMSKVKPGEQLLINNSWSYTMYLYGNGNIKAPWDVYDMYRLTHGENLIGLCQFDWFLAEDGSDPWPDNIKQQIQACGSFEEIFSTTSDVLSFTNDLTFIRWSIHTRIWQNKP